MTRNTRQRTAIQGVLQKAQRPLLPQEVLQAAQEEVPQLNLATVYRNLNLLVEEGLATPVHLPNQAARFERTAQHHHHFVCCECKKVFDIHKCSDIFNRMAPPGFTVHQHELTLYGQCPGCSPQRAAKEQVCC